MFETQQLAALIVEGMAAGGMLRLCEVHVLCSRGSFHQLLERTDASSVYVVMDATTCRGNFAAAPVAVVHDCERADGRALAELYPEPTAGSSPASRALEPEEEFAACMRLRDIWFRTEAGSLRRPA